MKVLLDTHALLWWLEDDRRLPPRANALLDDPATRLLVSIVTPWEITIKQALGKLSAPSDVITVLRGLTATGALALLPVTLEHLEVLAGLPLHHRDPFDRLIVAQAIAEEAMLLTADARLGAYDVERAW